MGKTDKVGNGIDNPSQGSIGFSQTTNARYGQKSSISEIQLKNIQATYFNLICIR